MATENYKWFNDRIRDKKLSQRAFAKLLNMDPSSLSLLLHGKRRMRVEQAAEIARLLGVPVADVMRHGGATIARTGETHGPASLPVVGWVDGENRAKLDWSKTDHRVEVEGGFPPTAVALQYRTAQTRADLYDGWIAVTLPPREPDTEAMLDRHCLVGIAATGEAVIRTVRRGYTPGRYTLLDIFAEPVHDAELAWFSPILAIKPA
jgi:transcriptional regulator with XRE-family HTH domain